MIYFCEVNKCGGEHASVNSKLLSLVHRWDPAARIGVYLSTDHWAEICRLGDHRQYASLRRIRVIEPVWKDKLRWLIKIVLECTTLMRILVEARRERPRLIFLTSLSPFANYVLHGLLRLYNRVPVIVVLHGELQLLAQRNPKLVDRWYARWLNKVLRTVRKNRKFLILGPEIRQQLLDRFGYPAAHFLTVPHPTSDGASRLRPATTEKAGGVVFGYLGTAKLAKNAQLFFGLADKLRAEVQAGRARFIVSGQVFPEMTTFVHRWVTCSGVNQPVAYAEYMERCLQMDYAIFFNSDENYNLISSGSVMDAVTFGIPIIALRSAMVERLFGLCQSPPGVLCEDLQDMEQTVCRLIEAGPESVSAFSRGVEELKRHFSDERIQEVFNSQLDYLIGS